MKTGKKNLLLAIGIFLARGAILSNSHYKYAAFIKQFDYPKAQATGLPMLVEFGFQGCSHCKKMMPVLKSLNKKHSTEFAIGYIDVIKNSEALKQYNIEVTPTLIFYDKDGKEIYRNTGYHSEKEIMKKWKEIEMIKE